MVQFAGTYKRTKEEKYEEFLSKLGVGFMVRKAATVSAPTMTISEVRFPSRKRLFILLHFQRRKANLKL